MNQRIPHIPITGSIAAVEIWAGGRNPALRRHNMPEVTVLDGLDQIPEPVRAWRQLHQA
jgi:hypothetical protein